MTHTAPSFRKKISPQEGATWAKVKVPSMFNTAVFKNISDSTVEKLMTDETGLVTKVITEETTETITTTRACPSRKYDLKNFIKIDKIFF